MIGSWSRTWFWFRHARVRSEAGHDAHAFRQDQADANPHPEDEETRIQIPDSIPDGTLIVEFSRLGVLEKKQFLHSRVLFTRHVAVCTIKGCRLVELFAAHRQTL